MANFLLGIALQVYNDKMETQALILIKDGRGGGGGPPLRALGRFAENCVQPLAYEKKACQTRPALVF